MNWPVALAPIIFSVLQQTWFSSAAKQVFHELTRVLQQRKQQIMHQKFYEKPQPLQL